MTHKTVLFLAALTVSGCASSPAAPAKTRSIPREGQATPNPVIATPAAKQERLVNPHVTVTMPAGWTPVDLTHVPACTLVSSVNNEIGARILIEHGKSDDTAWNDAEVMSVLLRQSEKGTQCSPTTASADGSVASFTVSKAGVRGKVSVRHFNGGPNRIFVLGLWPVSAHAEGSRAVDAVIATAEYR